MPFRQHLFVLIAGATLTVVLTWPLAANPAGLGRTDSGDARHGIWNVAWVAHALTSDPARLFHANIFDPLPNTLAYSEANLLAGLIAAPVWLATENPFLAMNVVRFVAFVLAVWMTFRLVHHLTRSRAGAAFAAIAYPFAPFVFSHFAHIQLLMTFSLPWVLLRLHRFVERPSVGLAAGLGLAMGVSGLACGYYGIFAGLAAGLGVLWFGLASPSTRRSPRFWMLGLLAAVVASAVVAPFFAPYLDIRAEGFERTLDDARLHSADWAAYLASPMLLHWWLLQQLTSWREVLFPGFLTIGCAAAAVVQTFAKANRPPAAPLTAPTTTVGFYVVLGALALWASFGPDAGLYTLLHEALPVFELLRAPARLGLLVTLALSVLAGIGIASLEIRMPGRLRGGAVAVLLLATVAGSVVVSLNLVPTPAVPEAYRRLAALPRAPVAEFPFFYAPHDRHRHTEYMLMSTLHWQPLVNGYSDHLPAHVYEEMVDLSTFPGPRAWARLDDHGVRYVVIHWRSYTREEAEQLHAHSADWQPRLRLIVERDGVALYEVLSRMKK